MKTRTRMVAAGAAALASYVFAIRPWHLRWGTTDAEIHHPLAGDDLIPHPLTESVRSITINAPATAVWPWLVKLDRAVADSTAMTGSKTCLVLTSIALIGSSPSHRT